LQRLVERDRKLWAERAAHRADRAIREKVNPQQHVLSLHGLIDDKVNVMSTTSREAAIPP